MLLDKIETYMAPTFGGNDARCPKLQIPHDWGAFLNRKGGQEAAGQDTKNRGGGTSFLVHVWIKEGPPVEDVAWVMTALR